MKTGLRLRAASLVCAGLMLIAACGGETETEPAVATASMTLNKDKAAIGSPVAITYKFAVAPEAKFDADYAVFVHVIEPDGERLWQDDHFPPTPTSKWAPGQTVEYTRTVFVGNYPYIGTANIRFGLYNPANGKRLPLQAQEAGRREYLAGSLNILPQSENIFLLYKEGWHPLEVDPTNPVNEWQWMRQTGTISFQNPKRDVTLYLDYDARPDQVETPQQVTVQSAGQVVGTFVADSRDRALRTFPITAAQLGDADRAELTIQVDRTFIPGGGDNRDLGIRIFHAFVEPK